MSQIWLIRKWGCMLEITDCSAEDWLIKGKEEDLQIIIHRDSRQVRKAKDDSTSPGSKNRGCKNGNFLLRMNSWRFDWRICALLIKSEPGSKFGFAPQWLRKFRRNLINFSYIKVMKYEMLPQYRGTKRLSLIRIFLTQTLLKTFHF